MCRSRRTTVIEIYNCLNDSSNRLRPVRRVAPTTPSPATSMSVPNPVSIRRYDGRRSPCRVGLAEPSSDHFLADGSCSGGSTLTCTPGLYAGGLNISASNRTVNFQAGNYQFGTNGSCQSSLCIGNSDTVNFGTGHYTFRTD